MQKPSKGANASRTDALPEVGGLLPEVGGLLPEVGGLLPEVGGLLPEVGGLLPEVSGFPAQRHKAQPEPCLRDSVCEEGSPHAFLQYAH